MATVSNSSESPNKIVAPVGNAPPQYGEISSNSATPRKTFEEAKKALEDRYGEVDIKADFNPYRLKENVEPFMGGYPIIFMTTPQMNIFGSETDRAFLGKAAGALARYSVTGTEYQTISGNTGTSYLDSKGNDVAEGGEFTVSPTLKAASSIFSHYYETDKELVKSLTYGASIGGTTSPWIKFLTNLFRGLTLKDFTMKTTEEYETRYGWRQTMPSMNTDSYGPDTLQVSFNETKNLDVIKFHYMWMEYIEAVRYGIHKPTNQMRQRRTIDYTSSLYYFLLDADLSRILFGCKYTGLYPTSVPISLLSTGDIQTRQPIQPSISYIYQHYEVLKPSVIYDFNAVGRDASKIIGFGNYGDSLNRFSPTEEIQQAYNYGVVSRYGINGTPIDFKKERSFKNVQICKLENKNYDSRSQTGFASNTNLTRTSFMLRFNNNDDKGFEQTNDMRNREINKALGQVAGDKAGLGLAALPAGIPGAVAAGVIGVGGKIAEGVTDPAENDRIM